MIRIGDLLIPYAFLGAMGIQEVYLGDQLIYRREESYCYIELTKEG